MSVMAAAFIATTAYSAWNQYQAGQAEAKAYRETAMARRAQARKLLQRAEINEKYTRLEGLAFKAKQESAFAESGIDLGSGLALAAFSDTADKIERRIEMDRMEAQTQADAILMEADLDITKAKMAQASGQRGAIGELGRGFLMMARG